MHRFAGLVLAASLLHLNVVRADVACGKHDHDDAAGHSMTGHVMDHDGDLDADAGSEAGVQGVVAHDESCETPSQPDCCQALASCSPAFGGDVESAIGTQLPSHEVAVTALIEIPLSRVTTPDPPPPKA